MERLMKQQGPTLKNRLTSQWIVLGIALSILGTLLMVNVYLEHRRTEAREKERLLTQARVIEKNMGQNLDAVNQVLAALRKERVTASSNIDIGERLKMLSDAMPGVRTLNILDSDGTIRASSRPQLIG